MLSLFLSSLSLSFSQAELMSRAEGFVKETSEYRCLQSQFSVLYNESLILKAQLDETRARLNTTRTARLRQLEHMEVSVLVCVRSLGIKNKKYHGRNPRFLPTAVPEYRCLSCVNTGCPWGLKSITKWYIDLAIFWNIKCCFQKYICPNRFYSKLLFSRNGATLLVGNIWGFLLWNLRLLMSEIKSFSPSALFFIYLFYLRWHRRSNPLELGVAMRS